MPDAAGREPVEVCARRVSVPVALPFGRRRDANRAAAFPGRRERFTRRVPFLRGPTYVVRGGSPQASRFRPGLPAVAAFTAWRARPADLSDVVHRTKADDPSARRARRLLGSPPLTYTPFTDADARARWESICRGGIRRAYFPVLNRAEFVMPVRIRRHDQSWHGAQVTDAKGIIAALADRSTACYTGTKPKFRILCRSI